MKRLLDYDPINGISCWFEQDRDEQVVITHTQDGGLIEKILEKNQRDQNDSDKTKRGIKQDWWKYANVPCGVMIEWKEKYGVDFWNPAHRKRVFELLNHPDYRKLKTTDKFHWIKGE